MPTRKEKRKDLTNFYAVFQSIRSKFFPDLYRLLKNIKDHRHQSYVTYTPDIILLTLIMKQASGLVSMRQMGEQFNTEAAIANLKAALGTARLEEIPHYDTINDFLKRLNTEELDKVRLYMVRRLLASRRFEGFRFTENKAQKSPLQKHWWLVAVDATTLHVFDKPHDKAYVKHEHKSGAKYYVKVLEAKLILGDMAISIATEFIDNEKTDASKQGCELNALYRLEKKLKQAFPRLPICILADSLYAGAPFFSLFKGNGWKYIVRFKEGKIKSVMDAFNDCREAEALEDDVRKSEWGTEVVSWLGGIEYKGNSVSLLELVTDIGEEGEDRVFTYLTDLKIDKGNAVDTTVAGRQRWKIENEGFNVQKNHLAHISHVNSHNYNAQKNHYLLAQITSILFALYSAGAEYFQKHKSTIQKRASLLLTALTQHPLTEEDLKLLKYRDQASTA